jgi:hypothetical protein
MDRKTEVRVDFQKPVPRPRAIADNFVNWARAPLTSPADHNFRDLPR